MQRLLTLLVALLTTLSAQSQILKTTNLNLNPGGKIYDVAYDKTHDVYFIVGDFTSVATVPRKNFAVIDASTFNLLAPDPISSIDGVIRSVELIKSYKNVYLPSGADFVDTLYSVYIGGNFQTINAQSRSYLARVSSLYTGQTGTASQYVLDSYDLHIDTLANPTMDDGIFDMTTDLSINNTATQSLSMVGNFTISTGAGAPHYFWLNDNDDLYNFARLTHALNNPQIISYILEAPLSSSITDANSPTFYDISYTYEGMLLSENSPLSAEHAKVYEFGSTNGQGSILRTYTNANNLNASGRESTVWIKPSGDTTLTVGRFATNTVRHESMTQNAAIIDNYTIRDIVSYNGDLYNTVPHPSTFAASLGKTSVGATQIITPTNLASFDDSAFQKKLHCQQDHLFLSDAGLTSVNGTARVGLAVFCLEPIDSKPFTSSDAMVCHTETQTYSIDAVNHADGYRWIYSGSGALYRITSSGNAWQPLSTVHLTANNANSIDIQFPIGSTSGAISVAPFSVCNTSSDYQYSDGQLLWINVNALPDISLQANYSLNCYSDSIFMVAQSTVPNVTYSWTYPNGSAAILNDTIIVAQGVNLTDSSYYKVVVTNPITACFSEDSTYFTTDLMAAPIVQSAITTNPTEFTCLTDSMEIQSNILAATVTWTSPSEVGTFPDPYWINAATFPSGDLTISATYLSNGCSTQTMWGGIVDNRIEAEGELIGYTYTGGGNPIDTLTCDNPSITVQSDVTAPFSAFSTAEWLDTNNVPTGSDVITFTQADANGANFFVRTFRTFNNDNGCTTDHDVLIICDFALPFVDNLADQTINCSQNEVLLTHPLNGSMNVVEGWLDGLGTQTLVDTITAASIGNYVYQVQSALNGCVNYDSVSVNASLDLWLEMPQDTLICPEQIVTISPTVIGNTETPSYVWSTGSTDQTETATGGTDNLLIVTVSTPSGCIGTDSTHILITEPAQISLTPLIACGQGSIQITNVTGGVGNFQYSIDGTTWSDSTNFSGLAFGLYSVSVSDSLGCVYDTTTLLDGAALSIEMDFAVSTYNEEGDTVILVNLTTYTGLDSVAWNLPPSADVTYLSDSFAILSTAVSGWYDVELIGYLGLCEFSFTSPVYFGDHAPVFDDSTVFNGIEMYGVYPNPLVISSGNTTITVDIEFGTIQNYSILVTTSLGQPIPSMSVQSVGEIVSHQLSFPVGTAAGTYRVHIISDYDAKQEQIVLD